MHRYRICAAVVVAALALGCVALPETQLPEDEGRTLVALDQQWNGYQRELYYHQTQGSVLLPYRWLMALEQPEVKFFGEVGMFLDEDYITRFGFLPGRPIPATPGDTSGFESPPVDCTPSDEPNHIDYNCGLPVGFSRTKVPLMRGIFEQDSVGLTCAACHTTELHFEDKAIRIDGATSLIDPTSFKTALGGAMFLTQNLPFRFNRFADRVLGEEASDADRDALRTRVDAFMTANTAEARADSDNDLYADYPGGFGRTDALARIANMALGTEMKSEGNLVVGDAPVKFPAIWDAPYFDWAQYNGSIEQSMTRNIGEALGVKARVDYMPGGEDWAGEGTYRLETSVDVAGLFALETLLRGKGDDYFNGLSSPIWPEHYLGPIDWPKADRGAALYEQRCAVCHLAPTADLVDPNPENPAWISPKDDTLPPRTPDGGRAFGRGGPWISNNDPRMLSDLVPGPYAKEEWFLSLQNVNIGTIRTDPGEAENFAKNIVDTGQILLPWIPRFAIGEAGNMVLNKGFPQRIIPAGVALQMVTIKIADDYYDRADALHTDGSQEELEAFYATMAWNLLSGTAADVPPAAGQPRTPDARLFREDGTIDRERWNGYRPPGAVIDPVYSARPLNGIWATPPYLHNGSVPSVYKLLSPRDERPDVFYTGSREYDPRNLGYRTERMRGAFKFDTRVTGNSNDGHRFEEGAPGDGIIGGELSEDERLAIIEFLKSLCPPGKRTDHLAPDGPRLCVSIRTVDGG